MISGLTQIFGNGGDITNISSGVDSSVYIYNKDYSLKVKN